MSNFAIVNTIGFKPSEDMQMDAWDSDDATRATRQSRNEAAVRRGEVDGQSLPKSCDLEEHDKGGEIQQRKKRRHKRRSKNTTRKPSVTLAESASSREDPAVAMKQEVAINDLDSKCKDNVDSDWDQSDDEEPHKENAVQSSRRRDELDSEDENFRPRRQKPRREERMTSSERPLGDDYKLDESGNPRKSAKLPLRSPICVVMGHVNAGKTKILDQIRNSNVQGREANGITQQIGATYLSIENVKSRTGSMQEHVGKLKYKIPGLLFIDTPGHESFTNLRARGSSLCDIAVIVVNIMDDLQPQTIESLNMLRELGTKFVVAINQIDRVHGWRSLRDAPFKSTWNRQKQATKNHFEHLVARLRNEFACQGLNTTMYYDVKRKLVTEDTLLVPVSALCGEGIPDLLMVLVGMTQKFMKQQLELSLDPKDFRCTILDVKQTVGLGMTADVILSNGVLRSGDSIVVCGTKGAIVTRIRALKLPHEAQEMRVKGKFRAVEEVPACAGVRICAPDLDNVVAGSFVLLVPRDVPKRGQRRAAILNDLKDEVQRDFVNVVSRANRAQFGVFVQASTLGALEALVEYLTGYDIPICDVGIGDVHKSDVVKAGVMRGCPRPELAVILAFNVRVAEDARQLAKQKEVTIFCEEVIYRLFDDFSAYLARIEQERIWRARRIAVFPCRLEILPDCVFCRRDPLILGCVVRRGSLRLGTPLVAQKSDGDSVFLGRVQSMEVGGITQNIAHEGGRVAVKIVNPRPTVIVQFGRQFDASCPLVSLITRKSLGALRLLTISQEDKDHLVKLKKFFGIIS